VTQTPSDVKIPFDWFYVFLLEFSTGKESQNWPWGLLRILASVIGKTSRHKKYGILPANHTPWNPTCKNLLDSICMIAKLYFFWVNGVGLNGPKARVRLLQVVPCETRLPTTRAFRQSNMYCKVSSTIMMWSLANFLQRL